MKICQVLSGYQRDDARIFYRQSKTLSKKYEVSIILDDEFDDEIIDDIKIFSIKNHSKKKSRLVDFLYKIKTYKKKIIKVNADIYILHSPELLMLKNFLKKNNKIIIYDAHEDMKNHVLEKEWLPKLLRKPTSIIVDMLMNFYFQDVDGIITPHSHLLYRYLERGYNTELIENFPIINDSDYQSYDARDTFCYTGTVYSYSYQKEIVNAISRLEGNEKYQVAGYIIQEDFDELNKFEKFEYLGRLNKTQLREFYKKCKLGFVVYEYKKNLGYMSGSFGSNKLFEYMEAGIPIICTNYYLWKSIIDEWDCGYYIDLNSSQSVSDQIYSILKNNHDLDIKGKNARAAIRNKYNWCFVEQKLLRFISDI